MWSGAEIHHFLHSLCFCKPIMASESFVHLGSCKFFFLSQNEAGSYSTDSGGIIQCDWSLKTHETERGVRELGGEEGSRGLGSFSHCGAFSRNAAQLSFFVGQHKASVNRPKVIICWPQNPHQLFSRCHLWIDMTTVKRMSGMKSFGFFYQVNLCHNKTL